MIREVPAMTVRKNLGELLNEVQYRRDSVVITKSGKPVAALVDIALFKKILMLDAEFEHLFAELGRTYAGVDEETALAEIKEAVDAARHFADASE